MFKLDENYQPLDRILKWDDATRSLIEERIKKESGDSTSFDFLTLEEGQLLQTIAEVLIGQAGTKHPVKFAEIIDSRFSRLKLGVRYDNKFWPRDFYRQGLAAFKQIFENRTGIKVDLAEVTSIEAVIVQIFEGEAGDFLPGFLRTVLHDTTEIYYSQPQAWVDIGFPGPAYPQGYPFLACDKKEKWEPDYKTE